MAKSMSIKLEFVAPLPQIAITRFTYNAVEFYGPQAPRYKEVDLYFDRNIDGSTFKLRQNIFFGKGRNTTNKSVHFHIFLSCINIK